MLRGGAPKESEEQVDVRRMSCRGNCSAKGGWLSSLLDGSIRLFQDFSSGNHRPDNRLRKVAFREVGYGGGDLLLRSGFPENLAFWPI